MRIASSSGHWPIAWSRRLLTVFPLIQYVGFRFRALLDMMIMFITLQKELLSVPRAIQNPEELFLLIKIFQSHQLHAEIARVLDSENVGLSSRIVQNDWSFIGTKLESLINAGMWAEGLSYAKSLLAIPEDEAGQKALQERDDWAVWNLLVTAAENVNNPE